MASFSLYLPRPQPPAPPPSFSKCGIKGSSTLRSNSVTVSEVEHIEYFYCVLSALFKIEMRYQHSTVHTLFTIIAH